MQISSTLSFLALTAIAAASSTFSLLTIRSGTTYQYLSIGAATGSLVLTSSGVVFELKDDKSLYDTQNKKYITLSDGLYVETDTPDKAFSVQDGYLSYGKDSFYACPAGKIVKLASSCSNPDGSPIALRTQAAAVSSAATSATTKTVKATSTAHTTTKATATPAASGNSKPFGIIAIHSGSQFQNVAIKKVADHLHVFSVGGDAGTDLTLTLLSDGTLTDQDGVGINWDSKTGELGDVDPFGKEKPTAGFSIKDGDLYLHGKSNWKACPSGANIFSLANNDCTGGTSISLHAVYA